MSQVEKSLSVPADAGAPGARSERGESLAKLDEELSRLHMRGQWQYERLLGRAVGGPRPMGDPHIWKWNAVYPKLVEACEALPESQTARRSILFENPGLKVHGTTHTLLMGVQIIKPGEVAWAHRHTMAAIRFVIRGDRRVYTVVDGEICPMEDYDLILTPQWTWHDHHNPAEEPAIWLDALDVPLVQSLNMPFYEPYPGDRVQELKEDRSAYLQERAAPLRPTWERAKKENFPMLYRWRETEARLRTLMKTAGSPFDGVSLEYANPVTGGPTLATLSCWIQMLRPGEKTRRHRHTSSAIYFVVRGKGATIVDGTTLEWEKYDSFVVPNWAWHEHVNHSQSRDSILFSVNDIPVLQAFGFYREEPENSLRAVAAPSPPAKIS